MSRKVLVISNNSFSNTGNNGKTLESIFSGYEKNNIAQIYFTDKLSPDFDFCDNYYRISDSDVFRGIFKGSKRVGGIVEKSSFKKDQNPSRDISSILLKLKTGQSLLRFCRDILWASNSWKSEALTNWGMSHKPDFVFFVAGGAGFSHKLALHISNSLNVPLVSFFTDDYLIYPEKRNLFDLIQRKRMKRFYKQSVNNSALCFAIGELMCETYSSYFGKTFYPIMNSVNTIRYVRKEFSSENIIINYFGSVHTNRWKMLIKLADILNLSNRKDLSLNIYVADKPEDKILDLFREKGVTYKGGVASKVLPQIIMQSDILLHVESDDRYSKSLTRLSVSTKLPEYLISGRPILGFGPRDVASMKLLSDNNIGIVISPSDESYVIDNQLEKLFYDSSFREKIARNGYNYAINNFNKKKITQDFEMKIEQVISGN